MAEVYTSGGSSVLYGFEAANAFAGNSPTTDKTFGLNTRVSTLSLTTNRIDFNKLGQVEPHAFGYGQQQGSLSVGFVFDTRTSHAIFGGIYGESSAAGNSGAPHYYPNSAIGENKAPVITKSIATQVQVQMGSNLSTRKLLGGIVNSIGLSTSIGEAVNGTVDITFGKEVTATSPAIASGTVTAQASVTGVPLTFAHGTLSVSNGSSLVAIAEVPVKLVSDKTCVPATFNTFPEARSRCSELVQESVESTQFHVLLVAPSKVKPPPSAVVSVGVDTLPSSIFLSSTVSVLVSMVVVDPLTVKSPETIKFPDIVPPLAGSKPKFAAPI